MDMSEEKGKGERPRWRKGRRA